MKLSEQERYQQAARRVKEEKGFYKHLISYMIISAFFIFVDILTSPGHWWFYWPMLAWGLGLTFHGIGVFGGVFGKDWEDKRIKKYMDQE